MKTLSFVVICFHLCFSLRTGLEQKNPHLLSFSNFRFEVFQTAVIVAAKVISELISCSTVRFRKRAILWLAQKTGTHQLHSVVYGEPLKAFSSLLIEV